MKIISWNVNGIRAVAKKGFKDFLRSEKPDILCLQEIKISDSARLLTEFDFAGYTEYWNSAERPGYSGTAILAREGLGGAKGLKIKSVKNGFGLAKFDKEGRVQTLETGKLFLLNVYFPNSNHELSRLGYKLEFNETLLKYIKKLEKSKPVVITGDFNVAHEEIDLARPKENEGSAGFTPEERDWMTKLLQAGFVDTFREKNGRKVQYSWWSFRMNARVRNIGWRIDYFCVSAKLRRSLKKAYILDKITGSDHAPIVLELS
ncbi:MAG: exodeoxyribonuclease III [Patescibacteria group bacterium]|jgi:exodeoxyribonuclease-3